MRFDMVNKAHMIPICTMNLRIIWKDENGKMRQLFHLVDSTWNDEGMIFGWHPQFRAKAQIVMTGLLLYLKLEYGHTAESYLLPGAI